MSLITAVDNSMSGLRAAQADMQIISSNISNASIEGYTRKSILQNADTNAVGGTGGVRITGYSRATSATLTKLLNQSISDNGLHGTQSTYINQIQDLLGSNQSNPALSQVLSDFTASWKSLAAAPEETTRKQDVLYKAQNLTHEITKIAAGLDKILSDAKTDMASSVDDLNSSLARIHDLNNEISSAQSSKQSSVDLEDLRDLEIRKVSSLLKVSVVERAGGRIALFTPSGAMLVDASATQYVWTGTTITQNGVNVTNDLKGGKLEAMVGVLDTAPSAAVLNDPGKATVYKISQQLDRIVDLFTNVAGTFAVAYDSATTVAGEQASAFFTGATRYNFAVNASLLNGTATVKQASATVVSNDLNLETRTITAGGLTSTNVSYTGFASAIITTNNQNSKQVADQAGIYSTQADTYTKRMKDETGVNVDEEVVRLTALQNNYSACARVISTVKQMYDVLNSLFV